MKIRVNRSVKGKAHIIFQAYELLLPSACSAFQLSSASPSMWAQNNHLFPHGQLLQDPVLHCTGAHGGNSAGDLEIREKEQEGFCPVLSCPSPKSSQQNTVRPVLSLQRRG